MGDVVHVRVKTDESEVRAYCLVKVIEHICRVPHAPTHRARRIEHLHELRRARWFLQQEIERVEDELGIPRNGEPG